LVLLSSLVFRLSAVSPSACGRELVLFSGTYTSGGWDAHTHRRLRALLSSLIFPLRPLLAGRLRLRLRLRLRSRNSGRACAVPSCIFLFFSSWSDVLRGGSTAMATDHIHITIMHLMRHAPAPDSSACTRFFQTSRFWLLCCARGLDLWFPSTSARGRNSGRGRAVPSCIFFFFSSSFVVCRLSFVVESYPYHNNVSHAACTRFFQLSRFWLLCCARRLDRDSLGPRNPGRGEGRVMVESGYLGRRIGMPWARCRRRTRFRLGETGPRPCGHRASQLQGGSEPAVCTRIAIFISPAFASFVRGL
jgi:hypothetical protein